MGKKETVFFALPIDQMKGKLATKQLNIEYAGQARDETAYNLPIGKHTAVNFRKYVVLTKTRGKNRFYIKQRTTINNTVFTQNAQALLAITTSFAQMLAARTQAVPQQRPYAQFLASYDDFAQEGQTLRDYFTAKLLPQIRQGLDPLYLPLKPVPGEAAQTVEVGHNPFQNYAVQYSSTDITLRYTTTEDQKKTMQKYYAGLMNDETIKINIVVGKKTKRTIILATDSGTPLTLEAFAATILGNSFSLTFLEDGTACTNMTIYTGKGNILASGVPFSDEAGGTALTKSTTLVNDMYIYFA